MPKSPADSPKSTPSKERAVSTPLIDTHAHLHDRDFFSDEVAREMLKRAYANNITAIICIGTNPADSLAARDFTNSVRSADLPKLYWTYGIHPENAINMDIAEEMIKETGVIFRQFSQPPVKKSTPNSRASTRPPRVLTKPVAIGEIGLDYHYPGYDKKAQIRLLEGQLDLATKHHLPVSFHVREAFPDFFGVVANFPKLTGVIHSFSDNQKHLKRLLTGTNFYIGVNGLATYTTLPTPPLERILLETDAPFLTPAPFRGIINESSYVREVASWLSHKLGQDYQTIAKETTKNAKSLFRF